MRLSRRRFARSVAGLAAVAACSRWGWGQAGAGPRVGLNTWSLRGLSGNEAIPAIIGVMKKEGLEDCELQSVHVEPAKFAPVFPAGAGSGPRVPPTPEQMEARKAQAAALTAWRMAAPLSEFEGVRAKFEKEGLRIKAYGARLGSSEDENERLFQMAKALGAETIFLRVPEAMTAGVAAAADRHTMMVGLQFADVSAMEKQLPASTYFRLDPDIGDLTKAKVDALEFVKSHYGSFAALDLKDAKVGGASVPFGEGDSQMKDVLQFLWGKRVPFTVYVDCDYPGTGLSVEEVGRCVRYVRGVAG